MVWLGKKAIGWAQISWADWVYTRLALRRVCFSAACLCSVIGVIDVMKTGFRKVVGSIRAIGQEPVELEMLRSTRIASADTLWRIVNDLADLETWHPLVAGTNAPHGQQVKPGLIYRTMSRYLPTSTQVFVERVLPGELVSMRLFPLPGLQERVTYRIVSTLCGTCVLYSITLSGWLSPLAWPVVKPQATKVAAALVEAAEMETMGQWDGLGEKGRSRQKADIFE